MSEYFNKNAIFGILPPDNPGYIFVILLFVIGGIGWTGAVLPLFRVLQDFQAFAA